jgi:hypothetical protein
VTGVVGDPSSRNRRRTWACRIAEAGRSLCLLQVANKGWEADTRNRGSPSLVPEIVDQTDRSHPALTEFGFDVVEAFEGFVV